MFSQVLILIYQRDLNKLKNELNAYVEESNMWEVRDGISNSAGNLSLHLIGNLKHFIGAVLGNSGYVRERDKEFSSKNIPLQQMITSIDETMAVMEQTLNGLTEQDLDKPFPVKVPVQQGDDSTRFMLVHLIAHLNYHLGQINYHRRLIDK